MGPLGPSWGPLRGRLGRLKGFEGASWPVLDRVITQKADMLKMYVFPSDFDDVCLFGVLSGPNGTSLGPLG
eukprot:6046937-Pyramimonas_sp.AAC.1